MVPGRISIRQAGKSVQQLSTPPTPAPRRVTPSLLDRSLSTWGFLFGAESLTGPLAWPHWGELEAGAAPFPARAPLARSPEPVAQVSAAVLEEAALGLRSAQETGSPRGSPLCYTARRPAGKADRGSQRKDPRGERRGKERDGANQGKRGPDW